jgi:hypothetical protein
LDGGALTLGAFFYIFPITEEGNKRGESFQEWNPRGAAMRAHFIVSNAPGFPPKHAFFIQGITAQGPFYSRLFGFE